MRLAGQKALRAVAASVALVPLAVVASCVGDDVSIAPGSSGNIGPADAGTDTSEPPKDVVTADVVPLVDAGADARLPKGCAAYPDAAFCADFDDASVPEQGWTSKLETTSGTLTLNTADSVSPPASMRSSVIGGEHAILQQAVPTSTTKVHLELDAKVSAFSTSSGSMGQIVRLFRNSDYNPSIQLVSSSAGVQLIYTNASAPDGGGTSSGGSGSLVIPTNTWNHLALDVSFDTPGSIALTVNGIKRVDLSGLTLSGLGTTGGFTIWVGSTPLSGSQHPPIVTDIDNVVLDFP